MPEVTFQTDLKIEYCAECCMPFAFPKRFETDRRNDGRGFMCPSGHSNVYGDNIAEKLRKELNAAKMREQAERDQRWAAELERDKLKNRISKGSCPCCKRNFSNLQRHMKTKHPDFKK